MIALALSWTNYKTIFYVPIYTTKDVFCLGESIIISGFRESVKFTQNDGNISWKVMHICMLQYNGCSL